MTPSLSSRRVLLALAALAGPVGCRGSHELAAAARSVERASSAPAPAPAVARPAAETTFAQLVAQLSEPGGYFDSDNIISNETSYLHVLDALRRVGTHGGVYIGVGPDQNFSYIAAIRPSIAFMLDVRRDNMLEHLLFKALFALARNRVEYLCLLLGRPLPNDVDAWNARSIDDIITYLDSTPADSGFVRRTRPAVSAKIASFAVPLAPNELEVIDRYRAEFVADGLDVRFSSLNRNNRSSYPDLRRLIRETDRSGHRSNYLATEESFQYLKGMEGKDRIVPVVGDAAGNKAVAAIARYAVQHGEKVSAFYISNVEQYLMRDGLFARFAENVKLLPRSAQSVIIRSYFSRFGMGHPLALPGHTSTSLAQTLDGFVKAYDAGEIRSYSDLVDHGYIVP